MNHLKAIMAVAATAVMLAACDDETGTFGISSEEDLLTTATETFAFTSRSLPLDSIIANSSKCYLGEVYDAETDTHIRAEFLAQFYAFENYSLPDDSLLIRTDGQLLADSVELRLYFSDYYGSASNPMQLAVFELDRQNVLSEDSTYYSDIDIDSYLPADATPLAYKVFTPSDYTLDEAERSSSSHYDNVRIRLPQEFGTRILQLANEHPEYFLTPWQFNHHVCAGLCCKLKSGTGTMLALDVSALNIYFRYHDIEADTIYTGISRFSATPEVIQSTRIVNSRNSDLSSQDVPYTFITSPAGIATELTLPVDEIFEGHEADSINRARIVMTRYSDLQQDATNQLSAPQTLLMLRKGQLHSFFKNRQLADNEQSYTTSFDSNYNTYTFANISRLLSYIHREKLEGMQREGVTSDQWEARHPDWNRMVLVPIALTTTTNQTTGAQTQVSITHDFSLSSARLLGGNTPLEMYVVYSRYRQ